jgi:hypothetical protein
MMSDSKKRAFSDRPDPSMAEGLLHIALEHIVTLSLVKALLPEDSFIVCP